MGIDGVSSGFDPRDLREWLARVVRDFVEESPLGRLKDLDGSRIWDEPLVAYADGDDPLFELYREVVAPFHLTPREALANRLGGSLDPSTPVSVVSWVLPTAGPTRRSNRSMKLGPSLRWNNTRFQGEDFNDALRRHLVARLEEQGIPAIAPVVSDLFRIEDTERGPASTWSERHVAFTAGHGTFSLSDGLITTRGIAHRCGSVVLGAFIPATARPYSHHMEYCLGRDGKSCDACIRRCPAGAIGPNGHDKLMCREYMFVAQAGWLEKPGYIGSYSGCGLCQVGVPCEAGIPR